MSRHSLGSSIPRGLRLPADDSVDWRWHGVSAIEGIARTMGHSMKTAAQSSDNMREFLTPAEAAAHLAISKRTLEGFRIRGGGPTFRRMGTKLVRYHRDDLAAWAEAGRHTSTSQL